MAVTGTLTSSLGQVSSEGSEGTVSIQGSLSEGIGPITANSLGFVGSGVLGSILAAIGPVTLSAQGQVGIDISAGSLNESIGSITLTSSGQVGFSIGGSLSRPIGPITVTASGIVGNTTGNADISVGPVSLNAQGTVSVIGSANIAVGSIETISLGEAPENKIQDIRAKASLLSILI